MIIQGQVGPPPTQAPTDGNLYNALMGKCTELVVSELMGQHYNQAVRGNVFHVCNAIAGVAIPISTTTAPTFILWNPAGSGKNAVLAKYTAAYVGGSCVPTGIAYYYLPGAGAGTLNTVVTAFTDILPKNALLGGGAASVMRFAQAATIVITGTTLLRPAFGMGTPVAATPAMVPLLLDNIAGAIIVPPGVAFYTAATAATVGVFCQGLQWTEVPI